MLKRFVEWVNSEQGERYVSLTLLAIALLLAVESFLTPPK